MTFNNQPQIGPQDHFACTELATTTWVEVLTAISVCRKVLKLGLAKALNDIFRSLAEQRDTVRSLAEQAREQSNPQLVQKLKS